jgi:uncharacterized repeat protein (TIGR03803 family)
MEKKYNNKRYIFSLLLLRLNKSAFTFVILFLFNTSYSYSQTMGRLWGLISEGGDSGGGVVFNYDKLTSYDSVVHSLPTTPEDPFYTHFIQCTDGNLYGMAEAGGLSGIGAVIKLNPTTGALTTLVNFNGPGNGSLPYGSLIQANDGNLYGLTFGGGSSDLGTLFKCTTTGTLTTLVTFIGSNGGYPSGSLIQASDGNLYGMTEIGGASSLGTLFKCTTSGTLTTLINFSGANGSSPQGSLIQATDGNLYGMTESGGSSDSGTIFSCTTSGTLNTIVNFTGTANGANPYGDLLQASDGNLYGMTEAGGTSDSGTLFTCTTTGTLTTLVNFSGAANGANPFGNLIQATDGNLYGTTDAGGTSDDGTIFSCTTSGTLTTLVNFAGAANGSNPEGSLFQATDGNLYGMTNQGGSSGNGTIFRCTTTGTLSTLIIFGVTVVGTNPEGSPIQALDGNIYAMTYGGGITGYDGTIFSINNNTGAISVLLNFNDTNGANPYGSLLQASDSNFYGMTNMGGTSSLSNTDGGAAGFGTIFKLTKTGAFTTLVNFNNSNGANPFGTLIQASDGNFYGLTYLGGTSHDGTLFKCTPTGTITTLVNFSGANGKYPFGSLIQASDGNLYGMTAAGGTSNDGILFRYTLSGTFTRLVNFNGSGNGSNPLGQLVQATDGNLYGLTQQGGTYGYGTFFKCTTSGTLTTLVIFNFANGATPSGSPIQASDSNIYGMTQSGGSLGLGTVFKYTLSGTFSTLVNLNGIPQGNGPQYGNLLEVMSVSISDTTHCNGNSTLVANVRGERNPCTYVWSTGATSSTISVTSSGTYSVAVTDARGITVDASIFVPVYIPISVTTGSTITICAGKSANLSASGNGGTGTIMYNWLPGNLSGAAPNVSPANTTTYTVIATDANGCIDSATQTIIIDPLPIITITGTSNISLGNSDTLKANGGISYMWTTGSTSDTTIVKPLGNTTYTVTGTNSNGCSDTASFTVTVNPTGINSLSQTNSLEIYPDPNDGLFELEINNYELGINTTVEVYNIIGEKIYNNQFVISNSKSVINIGEEPMGMYFVKVISGNNVTVSKFVKE